MATYLLLKAKKGSQKAGAKYYKRIPKAGGGYKYFRTPEEYKKHLGKKKGFGKLKERIKSKKAKRLTQKKNKKVQLSAKKLKRVTA
jgi:hypothetical protein